MIKRAEKKPDGKYKNYGCNRKSEQLMREKSVNSICESGKNTRDENRTTTVFKKTERMREMMKEKMEKRDDHVYCAICSTSVSIEARLAAFDPWHISF